MHHLVFGMNFHIHSVSLILVLIHLLVHLSTHLSHHPRSRRDIRCLYVHTNSWSQRRPSAERPGVNVTWQSTVAELIRCVLQTFIDETPTVVPSTEYVNMFILLVKPNKNVGCKLEHHRGPKALSTFLECRCDGIWVLEIWGNSHSSWID